MMGKKIGGKSKRERKRKRGEKSKEKENERLEMKGFRTLQGMRRDEICFVDSV